MSSLLWNMLLFSIPLAIMWYKAPGNSILRCLAMMMVLDLKITASLTVRLSLKIVSIIYYYLII